MPQENVIPTDPVNESVFHWGGLRKSGVGRGGGPVMQKHNLQLEAGFEQESNESTFREDTVQPHLGPLWHKRAVT